MPEGRQRVEKETSTITDTQVSDNRSVDVEIAKVSDNRSVKGSNTGKEVTYTCQRGKVSGNRSVGVSDNRSVGTIRHNARLTMAESGKMPEVRIKLEWSAYPYA